MSTFKKLALATALTSITALSVPAVSAPFSDSDTKVHTFKIEVDADTDTGAHIVVDAENNHKVVELSKEALSDPDQIDAALADLPEDVRVKVKTALNGIHMDGQSFAFKVDGGNAMNWFSKEGDKHVVMIDIDEDHSADNGRDTKIIKKFIHGNSDKHAVIELKHGGAIPADSLIQLIKSGEFSQDDLNKLQQALDAKR